MNLGIEQDRQEALLNLPDRDSLVDPVSISVGRNRFGWKSRIALVGGTIFIAVAGLFVSTPAAHSISEMLGKLKGSQSAGKEDPSRGNSQTNPENAAGNNRVLMPFAPWDVTPTPTATPPPAVTSERTPTPTATPTRTPILEPTVTPDIRPSYPWPQEIMTQLDQLPVLDRNRLQLGFYTTMDQIPYADIRALFRPPVGENADVPRRMIHILATDSVGGRDWLYGTWGVFNVGHAVGHFHQAEMSRQIGMDPDSRPNFQQWYLNTPEGRAYVPAANAAKNNASTHGADLTEGLPWEPNTFGNNPYEDAASMISLWYNQPYRFDNPDWAPLKEFAGQWWPKRSA